MQRCVSGFQTVTGMEMEKVTDTVYFLQEKADREFRERQEAMKRADEERVAKNREKRLKKKNKKKTKSKSSSAATANGAASSKSKAEAEASDSDSSDEDDEEGPSRKKLKLKSGAPGVVFRGADEREQDDDQPREEEIKVKRIEESLKQQPSASEQNSDGAAVQPQGLVIVDED